MSTPLPPSARIPPLSCHILRISRPLPAAFGMTQHTPVENAGRNAYYISDGSRLSPGTRSPEHPAAVAFRSTGIDRRYTSHRYLLLARNGGIRPTACVSDFDYLNRPNVLLRCTLASSHQNTRLSAPPSHSLCPLAEHHGICLTRYESIRSC